jgi:hypothetical protein
LHQRQYKYRKNLAHHHQWEDLRKVREDWEEGKKVREELEQYPWAVLQWEGYPWVMLQWEQEGWATLVGGVLANVQSEVFGSVAFQLEAWE